MRAHARQHPSRLTRRSVVLQGQRQRIKQAGRRFFKALTMLAAVELCFGSISFDSAYA
jgi:hypothetical protein